MPKTDSTNMLRFLDVLLKHGNFTRAAKDLYISQPYLTQTIKNAEKELGVPIINRDTTPLALTPAGRVYYQYLTSLENQKDQFHKQIRQYVAPDHQIIRIGVLSSLGYYLLPLVLPDFLQVHPEIKVELTEDILARNEQRLLHGEIDFLLGQNPETVAPGLTIHDRGRDGYYAIIPRTSPLYQPDQAFINPGSIDIQALLHAPLILSPRGSSIRRQVDYLLQKYNVDPQIVVESTNTFTIAKLAEKGLGVTFLPDSIAVKPAGDQYNLYPLPASLLSLNYFIAVRDNRILSASEHDLITIFLTNLEASLAEIASLSPN
ncbi:LysR family transcriptional regulator [Lactiplantibacillus fabifermentans]|uniref:Transcription regulator n=2 Tax=Lactiplantibacillus fabifermentans TaxID=483011 RepID=A0A0R2NPH7_9LACO|nr:LysR family transcriptional regulator [Lactiplantibacillus fabifermentans]ETY75491.1 LysR family transcriptional regulator [Lactiplantibacillus fabifermentans T30PCM01]KRO27557.1 transcription regulator [Lactiplantibacillus fabifermentans DSM 21115]